MTAEPPMIIKATFANIHPVQTRGVVQFIFEVKIEDSDEALKLLGGMPRVQDERWCAIARLDMDKRPTTPREKERRAFHELPAVQQAAIKCKDTDFQIWMNCGFASEQDCVSAVRKNCGVDSRADILPGTEAEERWRALLREYEGVR